MANPARLLTPRLPQGCSVTWVTLCPLRPLQGTHPATCPARGSPGDKVSGGEVSPLGRWAGHSGASSLEGPSAGRLWQPLVSGTRLARVHWGWATWGCRWS